MVKVVLILSCLVSEIIFPSVKSMSESDLREKCVVTENDRFSCDGISWNSERYLDLLDLRDIKNIRLLELKNFKNIKSMVPLEINEIIISRVKNVIMILDGQSLKNLSIEKAGHVNLKHIEKEPDFKNEIYSLSLSNIGKLEWGSEVNSNLQVKTMLIKNVIVDVAFRKLALYATDLLIKKSTVKINHELAITARSTTIDCQSAVELYGDGVVNITSKTVNILDSSILVGKGQLCFIDSGNVTFTGNKFFNVHLNTVHVIGSTHVTFNKNIFSELDESIIENFNSDRIRFLGNSFDCKSCLVKDMLLNSDYLKVGDTNYCSADCVFPLNNFIQLLNNSLVCKFGENKVEDKVLCSLWQKNQESQSKEDLTVAYVLQWSLVIVIPMILICALLCCICHQENRKKVREIALSKVLPHELECERGPQEQTEESDIFGRSCNTKPVDYNVEAFQPSSYR